MQTIRLATIARQLVEWVWLTDPSETKGHFAEFSYINLRIMI